MNPQELIDRVRSSVRERDKVMEELYANQALRANTERFILSNSGASDDVETILCDTIVNFVKNCYKPDFQIRTNIENYFFGVTKNLWFRTIRQRKPTTSLDQVPEKPAEGNPELLLVNLEQRKLLEVILEKIDEKCKMVLTLWARDMKMKAIAKELNYSSAEVVRKKKHFCLKKLIEIVNDHPEFIDTLKHST